MEHNYAISTTNIHLYPLSADDSQKLRTLRNRADNRNWFKTNNIISKESQTAWYEKYLTAPNEIMFSIYDVKTSVFLGAVALYDIDILKKQAEVGRLLIDRQIASGRGLGSEALNSICQLAFTQLGLNLVYAEIYANNFASIKSFCKSNFCTRGNTADSKGNPMIIVEIDRDTFFSVCPPSQT